TNWAHYHIASEPLAPGPVRPDLPRILSTKIIKQLENKTDNTYKTLHRRLAHLTRWHATLTPQPD
ncbi:hypothetical protein, partial [Enterobacter intestinihominis]